MLKEWQFNILFFVGVGGAVFLLLGPEFGLNIADNPTALAGVGSILTYILTQKKTLTKPPIKRRSRHSRTEESNDEDDRPAPTGVDETERGDEK